MLILSCVSFVLFFLTRSSNTHEVAFIEVSHGTIQCWPSLIADQKEDSLPNAGIGNKDNTP